MKTTTKNYNLKNIATVIAGYSFRNALTSTDNGNMHVIQAKDVKNTLYINSVDLLNIKIEYSGKRIAEKGDVMLSSRGFFIASVFNSADKAIATSATYIIKPRKNKILAEYLTIYLNSKRGQSELNKYSIGASIKTILIKDLQNIKILVPDIEKQKIIIDLYKQKEEHKKLLNKKEYLYEQIFQQIIKNVTT